MPPARQALRWHSGKAPTPLSEIRIYRCGHSARSGRAEMLCFTLVSKRTGCRRILLLSKGWGPLSPWERTLRGKESSFGQLMSVSKCGKGRLGAGGGAPDYLEKTTG